VTDIRGNVDTRISLVHNGSCDAVLLARAGLARLGRLDEITESLDPQQMLPAPGQGALAVECREDHTDVIEALAPLEDPDTRAAVTAERALLAALEAGCTAPIGALAHVTQGEHGKELELHAFAGSQDASIELRRTAVGPIEEPERLGRDLAAALLADGADKIVGLKSGAPPGVDRRGDQPEARGPEGLLAAETPPHASHPDRPATERAL
jgi:hydroxymethylbilane synthase